MTSLMIGAVEWRGSHRFIPTVPADFVVRQFLCATVSLGETQVPCCKEMLEDRALQREDAGQFPEKQIAFSSHCGA